VLIITTITTMLAFSQLSENRLQERIAGNQQKEINARLAAEKGLFYAFEYIEAESDQLNTDILVGLKALPTDNKEYSFPSDLIDLTGTTFTLVSKGEANGAFAYLKTTIEATAAIAGNFDDAVVGCEYVKVWGNGNIDSYNGDKKGSYSTSTAGENGDITVINGDAALGGSATVKGNVTASGNITGQDKASGTVTANSGANPADCDPLDIGTKMAEINTEISGKTKVYSSDPPGKVKGKYADMILTAGGGSMDLDILGKDKSVYVFDQLNVGAQTVIIKGDVTIYLDGNFTTKKSTFKLANTNSSLTILMTGIVDIGTGSNIFADDFVNENKKAPLTIYSSNATDSALDIGGNGNIYANVYAPLGGVEYNGTAGLFGALRGREVAITGTGDIHYDEGLAGIGNGGSSEAETSYSSVYYYYPDD
jgi:hypothetical protein